MICLPCDLFSSGSIGVHKHEWLIWIFETEPWVRANKLRLCAAIFCNPWLLLSISLWIENIWPTLCCFVRPEEAVTNPLDKFRNLTTKQTHLFHPLLLSFASYILLIHSSYFGMIQSPSILLLRPGSNIPRMRFKMFSRRCNSILANCSNGVWHSCTYCTQR